MTGEAAPRREARQPGLVSPSATQCAQAGDQEFRAHSSHLRKCPVITPSSEAPPADLYAEVKKNPFAGRRENRTTLQIGAPLSRPEKPSICPSWDAIQNQEAPSPFESDPIAMAYKTADASVGSTQDFRLLDKKGKIVTLLLDKGFEVGSLPQRKLGNLELKWAMGTRPGLPADGST